MARTLAGLLVIGLTAALGTACATRPHRPTPVHRVAPVLVASSGALADADADRDPNRELAVLLAAPVAEPPVPAPVPAPAPAPVLAQGAPYLVIADARLEPTGTCAAQTPMLHVHAVVENRGDAPFPGAPAYGLVGADLETFGSMIGNGGTVPAIPAGGRAIITFPIFYPASMRDALARATRYVIKLDRYGNFPAAQMDPQTLTLPIPRPLCGRNGGGTIARD